MKWSFFHAKSSIIKRGQMNLDSMNVRSMTRMNLLFASWDMLGWIYFMEDKTDLAEPYLHAAWKNEIHGVMGLHLGKVLEKQGNKGQAMNAYKQALGVMKGVDDTTTLNDLHTSSAILRRRVCRIEMIPREASYKSKEHFGLHDRQH